MIQTDGRHDFDFLFGRWHTHNERLIDRLQGSTQWETFDAINTCQPMLDGMGHQDEFRTEHWAGFIGVAMGLFNPATQQWNIYWVDNQTGILYPPVVGAFSNGVGIFEGPDAFEGKPITVRFIWKDITPTSARWEQEFSPDNGLTWEKNWVMNFTRMPE